jgi:hypothetical protein
MLFNYLYLIIYPRIQERADLQGALILNLSQTIKITMKAINHFVDMEALVFSLQSFASI